LKLEEIRVSQNQLRTAVSFHDFQQLLGRISISKTLMGSKCSPSISQEGPAVLSVACFLQLPAQMRVASLRALSRALPSEVDPSRC
jgi:hypothetical protein